MVRLLVTVIALALSTITVAQNEANFWFFGESAGLDFSNGAPMPITVGVLSTMEGCSSISSSTGILQFYSDGIRVWNRDNQIMPNGEHLKGDPSSTQSAIIVPRPGSSHLYYIFTIDNSDDGYGGLDGLNYSLVDMTLDNYRGDVVLFTKNILLTAPLCEKVTAVGHSNGTDIWVIAPKYGTNSFYSYLVTVDGVNHTPVISSAGDVILGNINAKGYMKVSPNGEKIAKANAGMYSMELFDFDNTTGIVSNALKDMINEAEPYGVEFSPNSSLLYISSWYVGEQVLFQYDLEAGSPQGILDSRLLIANGPNGALQLGPDNKIYVAQNQSSLISVINQPNQIGAASYFQYQVISLGGRNSRWGLPPFIQSFFYFNAGYYNTSPCFGTGTQFYENCSQEPDSVLWDFGNPSSGSANSSTENDPVHLFTSPGIYSVKLLAWITGVEVTVTHIVIVNEIPNVQLPADTAMCDDNYYTIDAGEGFFSYLWDTGDTGQSITVNTSGSHWVEVTSEAGCSDRDTIDVVFYPNPVADAGPTQTIMEGATTTLEGEASSGSGNYTYEWEPAEWLVQNNIPDPTTLALSEPTVYTLFVEDDNGCIAESDDVLINIEGAFLTVFPYAEPSQICYGLSTTISANASGGGGEYSYFWTSDPAGFESDQPEYTITPDVGTVKLFLTVTDQYLNTVTGMVEVVVNPLPVVNLIPDGVIPIGEDTIVVCVRDSVWLDAGYDTDPDGTSYFWESQNYLNRYYNASTNGNWVDIQTFNVEVTHGGTGCVDSGNLTIIFDFNECMIGMPEEPEEQIQLVDIYPNPNDGNFTLKLNQESNNLFVKVYDISGHLIFENHWFGNFSSGDKIELPILIESKGIYIVHIHNNKYSSVHKMFVR